MSNSFSAEFVNSLSKKVADTFSPKNEDFKVKPFDILADRYIKILGVEPKCSNDYLSDANLAWMCTQLPELEEGKANRWLGYIQGAMVSKGYIGVDTERNFTRLLFTKSDDKKDGCICQAVIDEYPDEDIAVIYKPFDRPVVITRHVLSKKAKPLISTGLILDASSDVIKNIRRLMSIHIFEKQAYDRQYANDDYTSRTSKEVRRMLDFEGLVTREGELVDLLNDNTHSEFEETLKNVKIRDDTSLIVTGSLSPYYLCHILHVFSEVLMGDKLITFEDGSIYNFEKLQRVS